MLRDVIAQKLRPYQNMEFVGVNGIDPSSGGALTLLGLNGGVWVRFWANGIRHRYI